MPLFLLWRGIIHTTLHYPEHKFLLGGVSISNQFSDFSKSLMIEFMKSHYYDPYIAQYIHPKKEYKVKLKDADKDFVFNETEADLNGLTIYLGLGYPIREAYAAFGDTFMGHPSSQNKMRYDIINKFIRDYIDEYKIKDVYAQGN
jgi:hypothetical protein